MITMLRYCIILIVTVFSGVVSLAQISIEERLNALESRLQMLAEENADLKRQLGLAPKPTPAPVQAASNEGKLRVGGFLQGQAEFGGASDPRWGGVSDRFFFRRARIFVSGNIAEHFDFKAELDLQGNTLSAGTGHRAQANEIFVNWHRYPAANVRFGQLKTAFGGDQLMSDTKTLTVERYLGSDRLTDGRQLAVAMLGEMFDKKLSYYVVAGNGNGANVSANDNENFQYSARVTATPFSSQESKLTVAANGLWTEDAAVSRSGLGFSGNMFSGKRSGIGADASFVRGPLTIAGEWLEMDYRPTNAVPDAQFDARAWKLLAAYFFVPQKLQGVVRRESFDPNRRRGGDVIDSWLFGLNYYLKGDDLKLQLNYLRGDNPGTPYNGGRLLTRVQVMF